MQAWGAEIEASCAHDLANLETAVQALDNNAAHMRQVGNPAAWKNIRLVCDPCPRLVE
jgi:hypothetical protein